MGVPAARVSASAATSSAFGRVASNEALRMNAAIAATGSARSADVLTGMAVVMDICRFRAPGALQWREFALPSLAPARDHVGFVVEPESAVIVQHLLRGLQIASVGNDFGEAIILDLRNVDGRVPRREQRRGADR